MDKRIADILEKFGVGSLLIGLYQFRFIPALIGAVCIYYCISLTRRLR